MPAAGGAPAVLAKPCIPPCGIEEPCGGSIDGLGAADPAGALPYVGMLEAAGRGGIC